MKLCRVFSRILFILLLISTLTLLALYIYGNVSFYGSNVSIMVAIDLIIGVLDINAYVFASVYSSIMGMFVGIAYIAILVVLIKKVIRMLKYISEVFSKTSDENFAKIFTRAIKTNVSIFFCVLIFMFIAATSFGVVLCDFNMYLYLINFIILATSLFFESRFIVSTLKGEGVRYSIFNTVRAFAMISGAAFALDYIASSSFMGIIYNINTLYLMGGDFGSGRYNLYVYYSYLVEPIILFVASIVVLRLFNKITKNFDNCMGTYCDISRSLLSLLVFSLIVMVVRIIMVVYCGSDEVELDWSAQLLRRMFGSISYDLVPFSLIIGGLMIINNGMPAIEYDSKRKIKEIYT